MRAMTIKDIAQQAGVSVTTVSNVIHGATNHVSPATVEKINKIITQNNYVPNMSARALVNKNSRIVGVINREIGTPGARLVEDPFLSMMIRSIERELRSRGYFMMMGTVATVQELNSLFNNWNMCGMIFLSMFDDDFFTQIIKSKIPSVCIDSYVEDKQVLNVGIEDRKGGYLATKHLIEKGHKNIAFVSPEIFDRGVIHERYMGYVQALEEAGLSVKKENLITIQTMEDGNKAGHMLSSRRDLTAAFATADLLAAGILTGLSEEGLHVPEDFSLIGFDDIFVSSITVPPLTAVKQDMQQKGFTAVDVLIDTIEGKTVPHSTILPVSLVERQSVAKLN